MRAFVFPGQGSQSVGMGKALADASPAARELFQEVDDALSHHLFRLMVEGPEDRLTLTENAQPAIMANAIATLRVMQREGGFSIAQKGDYVAGHSLGEYSALCAAEALDAGTTARLLRLRGQAMQAAVPVGEGAMAALLGADIEKAQALADAAAQGEVCAVANDNDPSQVVISGHKAAIDRAVAMVKEHGIKRGILLPVSAPFHCELMQPAADAMATGLGVGGVGGAAAAGLRQCAGRADRRAGRDQAAAGGASDRPGTLARVRGGNVGRGRYRVRGSGWQGVDPDDQAHRP